MREAMNAAPAPATAKARAELFIWAVACWEKAFSWRSAEVRDFRSGAVLPVTVTEIPRAAMSLV